MGRAGASVPEKAGPKGPNVMLTGTTRNPVLLTQSCYLHVI
jgi:hypothetical protein